MLDINALQSIKYFAIKCSELLDCKIKQDNICLVVVENHGMCWQAVDSGKIVRYSPIKKIWYYSDGIRRSSDTAKHWGQSRTATSAKQNWESINATSAEPVLSSSEAA